jgi:hypothetical protein
MNGREKAKTRVLVQMPAKDSESQKPLPLAGASLPG